MEVLVEPTDNGNPQHLELILSTVCLLRALNLPMKFKRSELIS